MIAGKVMTELAGRNGQLIEIELSPEQARMHQFRPNQTVWIRPSTLHLFADDAA